MCIPSHRAYRDSNGSPHRQYGLASSLVLPQLLGRPQVLRVPRSMPSTLHRNNSLRSRLNYPDHLLSGFEDQTSRTASLCSNWYFSTGPENMPESQSPSNLTQSSETCRRNLPADIAQSLQRSAETAELSLRALNRLAQTTSSQQWKAQSQQDDQILLEIRRGSWLGHYRCSEAFSDRLAGLLDTYLQNWERDGLNEQLESKTPKYNSFPFARSSLHFCAAFGCEGLANVYLQMGQNPNLLARPSGQCPLHLAAAGGHIKIVKMLLDRGADIEARTAATGRTALQIAAFRGREEAVRVLLENGADFSARDNLSQSAADLALSSGYDQILGLLLRVDIGRSGSSAKIAHGTPQLEQTRVLPLRTRMEKSSSSQAQLIRAEKTDSQRSFCLRDSYFPHSASFLSGRRLASREHAQISHSSCTNCSHQTDECCSQEESDGWVDVGLDSGGDSP